MILNAKKLFELHSTLAELMADPAANAEAINQTLAEIQENLKKAVSDPGQGDKGYEALSKMQNEIAQLKANLDKNSQAVDKLTKLRMQPAGSRIKVVGRAQLREMFQLRRVFQDDQTARHFGAWACRAILGNRYKGWYEENVPASTKGLAEEIVKALDPAVSASGGAIIPPDYKAELITMLEAVGNVFPLMRRVPLTTTGLTYWPKLTGELTMAPVSASAKLGESAPTFDTVTMQPTKWGCLVPVPNEFYRNPGLLADLGQLIGFLLVRAAGYAADNAVINGDGTATYGGITGFLQDSGISAVSPSEDHDAMSELTGADIMAVPAAVTVDYVNDPYWLFHLSVRGVMRQLVDGDSRPLFDRGENGEPNTIDGYRYNTSQRMPASSAVVAGGDYAVFGDLEMSHYFGMIGDINIAESTEVYFDKDMTAIRGLMHIDCERIDANALKRCQLHS